MGRKLVITSGKGGVGKTTVTANLGTSLAERGRKVVLVDADIGLNNLDVVMGIENRIVYDMGDVADGSCQLRQALVASNRFSTLFTLPSSKVENRLSVAQTYEIVMALGESFDYVLIDCPAGIEEGFHRAVACAEEAIIVTTPHIAAIRDGYKVASILGCYENIRDTGLVINRVKSKYVLSGEMPDARDIASVYRMTLKGAIPEDDGINLYSLSELGKNGNVRLAYSFLADYVEGIDKKIFDCSGGFISRLFRKHRAK